MIVLSGFIVLVDGLDVFILRDVAAGSRRLTSDNLSFATRTLFGWVSEDEKGKVVIALAEGLCVCSTDHSDW
jgi:hypothetical protein